MKLKKTYVQTFVFLLVYLFAIYLWTQPLARGVPYGEFDAISHFQVADYMAQNDRSLMELPPYIDIRYGEDNLFKNHVLWYPPTFHSSLGVMQIFGGERIVPIFLMNTILATFILISVYFVINRLFGWWPAILSALLLIFSPRDFMPFLWGQWPERFSYAFIPLILYCFYVYYKSHVDGKPDSKFFYMTSLLLIFNLLVHPLGFFHSLLALAVLYVLLYIKHRKLAFNLKHKAIGAAIFAGIFLLFPFQTFNILPQFGLEIGEGPFEDTPKGQADFSRIFRWSFDPQQFAGSVPASYFSFGAMHGWWMLIPLLAGIVFLLIRRKDSDLILLAWLIGLYLALHRDFLGIVNLLHRSLSATAHIFVPIAMVGIVSIWSLIKMPKNIRLGLQYVAIIAVVYFAFTANFPIATASLNKEAFNNPLTTPFPEQVAAADWILKNTDPNQNISLLGVPHTQEVLSPSARKARWYAALHQHVNRFFFLFDETEEEQNARLRRDLVLLDYTVLIPLQNQEPFSSILQQTLAVEQTKLTNHTLLYNENGIKVYIYES